MYNQNNAGYAGAICTGISLHQMVNRLIFTVRGGMADSAHLLVNEVPEDIRISANEEKIATVIHELLSSVLLNARNGEIYIGANRFRDVVILEIQDRNNYNGYALGCRLKTVEPEVSRMGGYMTTEGLQKLIATVSFSFPNLALTA